MDPGGPIECMTCKGAKRLQEELTLAALAALLREHLPPAGRA
jgi:hypothetical protein